MSNSCIFFASANCWQTTLVLASSNYSAVMGSGGMCTPCTNSMLLGGYNRATFQVLDHDHLLMSGARPQYAGMI